VVCLPTGPADSSEGPADPPSPDPTPSARLRAQEQERLVEGALGGIDDPTDREIVRLYFFAGLSLTKIADRLGVTLDRVRKGFHDSLRRMRLDLDALQ
jgi:RNA polymerase sigma factor (sigma-70 family)